MSILQIIILIVCLYIAPCGIGMGIMAMTDNKSLRPGLIYISGLWGEFAIFQIVFIPSIVKACRGRMGLENCVGRLCGIYQIALILVFVLGIIAYLVKNIISKNAFSFIKIQLSKYEIILWSVFALILLGILAMSIIIRFEDGDDSYFLSVANISTVTDSMYSREAYTGGFTEIDVRHALAPFPIFIAWLSRLSGVHSSVIAHVCIPLVVIPATLLIYGMIGNELIKNKVYLPVFMIAIEIALIFGNYSEFSKENFLIVRNWQGKSVFANIILSSIFLMIVIISKRMEENKKTMDLIIPMCILGLASTLLTVQGAVITLVLLGLAYLVLSIVHKNFTKALCLFGAYIPCLGMMGLYVLLR